MYFTLSKLRNMDIINNDGNITNYTELSDKQTNIVISQLLEILNLNMDTEKKDAQITSNIDNYLEKTNCIGRTILTTFPVFILRDILHSNKTKMIDYILLDD